MKQFLLFQLYGPLAAWGEIAVGEERPSSGHPGKSAILGLLAAAKGLRRDEENTHLAMEIGYGIAVQVTSTGTYLRDYHTTQVPPKMALKSHPAATRRDELAALSLYQKINPKVSGTILSNRGYRCDALYQVAVWENAKAPYSLSELKACLSRPHFTVYLGRKSCPLGLPMQAHVVEADTMGSAYKKANFKSLNHFVEELGFGTSLLPAVERVSVYWEYGVESGIKAREIYTRRDRVLSRRRWQFEERQECHAVWNEED